MIFTNFAMENKINQCMIYNNQQVRRQDRLLEEEQAIRLLKESEYGVLSIQSDKAGVYGLPIDYVWDGESSLYLHCAQEGHKLDCIAKYPKVSFCIIGHTNVISNKFTTAYESIILTGEAHIGLSSDEKMKALKLILQKYCPNDQVVGQKYAEKSFHRTEVIRIDIDEFSGKCKCMHP